MPTLSIHIEPGCIQCFWCQNLCPQVFEITEDGCVIRAGSRLDQISSDNRSENSPLKLGIISMAEEDFMPFLAGGCPSQVISIHGFEPSLLVDPQDRAQAVIAPIL